MNARQRWALAQLGAGGQLRRIDLEKQFGVSPTTAKRDLRTLSDRGLVTFVGPLKTGFYRLAEASSDG